MQIPFNKPFLTGDELDFIEDAVSEGKISGNGKYTKKCQQFFQEQFGFNKCLLTTSCTDALEMAAILLDIDTGDEVIMPSYTFVSTANAFVLRGARIRFVDSRCDHPGMDESKIEDLINENTKAIVVVHYAGVACNMDEIMALAERYDLFVVEDAAQAIDSYYIGSEGRKRPLGGVGHLSTFSFHETKNIISGEGGMLVVNDDQFSRRSEIIWEKGTDRAAFFRGEVDKYGWVDVGSSFLPSELNAAFLFAQLQNIKKIQDKRLQIWKLYHRQLKDICNKLNILQPTIPDYATNNTHMYYLVCNSAQQRDVFISYLRKRGIHSVFHYQALHKSAFYKDKHDDGRALPQAERYTDCLVRLPFYFELSRKKQNYIINSINNFENIFKADYTYSYG